MTITDKQVEAALEAANRFALRSDYPTTAEDCMRAALEAAARVAADAAQAVAPYGWAIEDCNGAHHRFYPRHDYAMNSMRVIESHSPADSRQVEHADREFSGVAPHRLLALYATPLSPAPGVDAYPQAARVIAMHLKRFCDESLSYPEMIADAARKAASELDRLTQPPPADDARDGKDQICGGDVGALIWQVRDVIASFPEQHFERAPMGVDKQNLAAAIDILEITVDALQSFAKSHERYQWLRKKARDYQGWGPACALFGPAGDNKIDSFLFGDDLDSAIDRAMGAQGGL